MMCHVSCLRCHVSRVNLDLEKDNFSSCQNSLKKSMCHMSRVTCHMSLTLAATATDPPPSNSNTMYSRIFAKDQKLTFYRGTILNHFLTKIINSETNVLSSLLCKWANSVKIHTSTARARRLKLGNSCQVYIYINFP